MLTMGESHSGTSAGIFNGACAEDKAYVHLALAISDYGYVLAEGKIDFEGPARKLIKDEHICAAYLGL